MSSELDYKVASDLPLQYSRQTLYPLNTITTISTTQPSIVEYQLPNDVLNLSKIVMNFTLTMPTGLVNYAWFVAQGFPMLQSIQLCSSIGGGVVAEAPMLNFYSNAILRYVNKLKDIQGNDNYTSAVNLTGLTPCNVLSNVNYTTDGNPGLSEPSYSMPRYLNNGTTGGGDAYAFSIKLGDIPHTLFSEDKLSYFGQSLYLRVQFAPRALIASLGTSSTVVATGLAELGADITVGSMFLYTSQLKNTASMVPVREAIMSAFNSADGIRIGTERYYAYSKPYTASTSQPNSLIINRSMGQKLKRVYYGIFNSSQANSSSAYDHRIAYSTLANYNSLINNNLLQDQLQLTSNSTWYVQNKNKLINSCVPSAYCWSRNFMHIDDFTNTQDLTEFGGSLDAGLPIDQEMTYQWQCSTASVASIHYYFVVVQQTLVCSKDGIRLV